MYVCVPAAEGPAHPAAVSSAVEGPPAIPSQAGLEPAVEGAAAVSSAVKGPPLSQVGLEPAVEGPAAVSSAVEGPAAIPSQVGLEPSVEGAAAVSSAVEGPPLSQAGVEPAVEGAAAVASVVEEATVVSTVMLLAIEGHSAVSPPAEREIPAASGAQSALLSLSPATHAGTTPASTASSFKDILSTPKIVRKVSTRKSTNKRALVLCQEDVKQAPQEKKGKKVQYQAAK